MYAHIQYFDDAYALWSPSPSPTHETGLAPYHPPLTLSFNNRHIDRIGRHQNVAPPLPRDRKHHGTKIGEATRYKKL